MWVGWGVLAEEFVYILYTAYNDNKTEAER